MESNLNSRFIQACNQGDLDEVSRCLTRAELPQRVQRSYQINWGLRLACQVGHLHLVKYLLSCPDIAHKIDIAAEDHAPLKSACSHGHWELFKYLLQSPELAVHGDIHAENDFCIRWVLRKGNFTMAQYMMEHGASIYANNNEALNIAACDSQLQTIDFILGQPTASQHITAKHIGVAVEHACDRGYIDSMRRLLDSPIITQSPLEYETTLQGSFVRAMQKGHVHIMHYLIMEKNLELAPPLMQLLKSSPTYEVIWPALQNRQLAQSLNTQLPTASSRHKAKI